MTKKLFELTGERKYGDWFERCFLNTILSSQHPETGMTTYFQPMATGYFKVYGERHHKFWCCIGTGMENFSKLQEGFYFTKGDTLIVNQYLSSAVVIGGKEIVQTAEIPARDTVTFDLKEGYEGSLVFRLPEWLAGEAKLRQNDEACTYKLVGADKGYALAEGPFAPGTRLTLTLPMKVTAKNLPDGENTYAFQYGPVVLSALLGTEEMNTTTTGVDVTIPEKSLIKKDYVPSERDIVTIKSGNVAAYMNEIERHLVRQGEKLQFLLQDTDSNLVYVPHYRQYKERYGIYFTFRV